MSIFAYAETPATALECLASVAALRTEQLLGVGDLRLLVYLALRRLYLAEKAGGHWPVPLALVAALQQQYREATLDLDCFVPCPRTRTPLPAWYYLTGLHGRATVAVVASNTALVRERLYTAVPWLRSLEACDITLHVAGSLLTWAMLAPPPLPVASPWSPNDTDLFCESATDLDAATAAVAARMQGWLDRNDCIRHLCNLILGFPSATRRTLVVEIDQAAALAASPAAAGLLQRLLLEHPSGFRCDVYVNSVERVRAYHLPAVRASLQLTTGHDVQVNPSCAIALATSLNVDFALVKGKKTPLEILQRKWHLGFNFCLTLEHAQHLSAYLRRCGDWEWWHTNEGVQRLKLREYVASRGDEWFY